MKTSLDIDENVMLIIFKEMDAEIFHLIVAIVLIIVV